MCPVRGFRGWPGSSGDLGARLTGTLGSPVADITDAGTLLFPEPAVNTLYAAAHCRGWGGGEQSSARSPRTPCCPSRASECGQRPTVTGKTLEDGTPSGLPAAATLGVWLDLHRREKQIRVQG